MPTQTKYSVKRLEQLKKDISILTYNEHCEIFNIIRKDNDKISENNNGVFINLKYLKNETLSSLVDFVTYCNNRNIVKEPINQLNLMKNEDSNIENLYSRYNTLGEDSYKVYDISDNIYSDDKKIKPILVNNSKSQNVTKLDSLKERIYKKCMNKNSDTKLDNNDSISNISSKNEEIDSSSNEYLKL